MSNGTSMGQEICLILGQVSLSLFTLLSEKPPDGYMSSGEETDKTASDIQARSSMGRTLERNGKECIAEGEA